MVELFRHLFPLDLSWIINQYQTVIYIVLFLIIFIETGVVAFPVLPGDSLLFMAGFAARSGDLNLAYLLLLLFAAAVLGDNSNYWIGRTIGTRIFNIKFRGKQVVKKKYLDQTQEFFGKHGTKAIIMARFVPFVRTFAPFAAGVGKMNYKKYLIFDIIGGALWIGGLTTAGYLLGEISFIKEHVDLVCIAIVGISVLPMIIKFVQSRMKKKAKP